MSALVTTWFVVTAAPASAKVPAAGRDTIRTLASVSLAFASAKPKSVAVKGYAVSRGVKTVLLAAVGAALTSNVTVMVSPELGVPEGCAVLQRNPRSVWRREAL